MYTMVVVDDEKEIRRGFCTYFPWEEMGFHVAADFASAQEADEYLRSHHVDVLVTDIRMRGMSGIELIQRLRERGDDAEAVVISGYRDFEYARQTMKMSVRHYLVKPIKYRQIVEVFAEIRATLEAKRGELARETAQAKESARTSEGNEIVRRIKAYIHEHYEDATLEGAAECVRMNPYYLSSYFHQQTGEKFSEYLNASRMKEAARLLLNSSLRIQEIGRRVGYTTPNSFSRSFRQYYKMTPKQYRMRQGGGTV